jgi:hypothetical protein
VHLLGAGDRRRRPRAGGRLRRHPSRSHVSRWHLSRRRGQIVGNISHAAGG